MNAFGEALLELEKNKYSINILTDLAIGRLTFDVPSLTTPCGLGEYHVVIKENGRLAGCPLVMHEDDIIPDDDLLVSIRNIFAYSPSERNNDKNSCLVCQWFPVCVGGCPLVNKRINGVPFSKSPLHDFYQFIIPRYIKFCGNKILQQAKKKGINGFDILDAK